MQKVSVTRADGQKAILALVRKSGGATYVCPIGRYPDAQIGKDVVVGFPNEIGRAHV